MYQHILKIFRQIAGIYIDNKLRTSYRSEGGHDDEGDHKLQEPWQQFRHAGSYLAREWCSRRMTNDRRLQLTLQGDGQRRKADREQCDPGYREGPHLYPTPI